jgi:ribonuclease HII
MIGVDEVGRGCWAGPLVAGAVMLGESDGLDIPVAGLTDSKLLSPARRRLLATEIYAMAQAFGLGWVSSVEVDQLGLTAAVRLAMQRAVAAITDVADEIIIDGSYNFLKDDHRARTLVKADLTIPSVSAASIIAKVARDAWMSGAATKFPGYGFERHVGYGTKQHLIALQTQGICELHRKSFRPIRQFC